MSETKYPLCARAGLKVTEGHSFARALDAISLVYDPQGPFAWIAAADVEKLLEGAPVVRARLYDNEVFGEWFDRAHEQDTHTARLVMIEPIVKDTPEMLLREYINLSGDDLCIEKDFRDLRNRIKKYLEGLDE